MHEVALGEGLIGLVADEARRVGASRVTRVVVEIGTLSHVEPHAFRQAFEAAATGTLAGDAVLDIREPEGRAWCMACEREVAIARRGDDCPACGSARLFVRGGEEMRLKELEVV